MRKLIIALAVGLAALAAQAQTLTAVPYPSTAGQPDSASLTVNGGSPIPCTLAAVSGGVQPTCSLASLTTVATYTLVLTVSRGAGCSTGTNAGTCWPTGSASSTPFAYGRLAVGVTLPAGLKLAP